MSYYDLYWSKTIYHTTTGAKRSNQHTINFSEARRALLRSLSRAQHQDDPNIINFELLLIDLSVNATVRNNRVFYAGVLSKFLRVLCLPETCLQKFKDSIFFRRWPTSEVQLDPIVGEARTYTSVCQTSGAAWTHVIGTSSTVGIVWCLDFEGRDEAQKIIANLSKQTFLVSHPLALALWSHQAMLTACEAYKDAQAYQILAAQQMTGHHNFRDVISATNPDMIDFANLSAKISGTAANVATNKHCLQGLHNMMSLIREDARALKESDILPNAKGFALASTFLEDQAQSQLNDSMFSLQEIESLQQKASIILQSLFQIIAQRDQSINISIARDSRSLAKASIRDSTSMKAIAAVTMFFLPGTFVASLYSTGLFEWDAEPPNHVISERFWAYWALTAPLTFATVVSWFAWTRYMNKLPVGYLAESMTVEKGVV